MKHSRLNCWLLSLSLLVLLAPSAQAKEEVDEFLEQLHERGYGEVTLDYLDYLKQTDQLPEDVTTNWDLYASRGWRMAIGEAFNDKEADERTVKAKEYLDKFMKDHPGSPDVGEEVAEWGDMSFKSGLRLLGQSRVTKDKEKKAALVLKARAVMEESIPRFQQSVELRAKKLAALKENGGGGKAKPRRGGAGGKEQAIEMAELIMTDAQLKQAKAEFFLGQTYADDETETAKASRKTVLEKARKQFNEIYQRYRTIVIGLLAHTYEGKCSEELGDLALAKEMYDEVLALMPSDPKEKGVDKAQESLWAQVEYFYLMIVLKESGAQIFLPEAREFLKTFEKWQRADGYQGVALEVAKADVDLLEKGKGDQKNQVRKEVDALLKMMKKNPSEYHKEGMELAKELNKKASGGGPPKTYDEAMANADDLFEAHKWDEAAQSYELAIKMAGGVSKTKKKEVQAAVGEKLETCLYNKVFELFSSGKEDEAIAEAATLTEENKIGAKSETAGKLAALRVHIILRRYAASKEQEEKEKLLTELTEAASAVIDKWPDKPSADDARIAMAQAAMVQNKTEEAATQLEGVNPRSERFAAALYMAAQGHLRLWNVEKQKAPAERKAKAMKGQADKAIEDLEKSIELQTKAATEGQSIPQQLIEAQLVLGQIYLETGEAQKAAELLQPVVDAIKASKPEKLDPIMLKVFNTAVKACVATGDMVKGGEVATLLTDLGEDTPEVNAVLVTFARMLYGEYRQASATLIEAKAENDLSARETAEARLTGTKELLGKLLDRLAPRENNTPVSMISIGDMATDIGQIDLAEKLYNRILDKAKEDPEFAEKCGKPGLVRVRAQLVDILRQQKQFEQGLKVVNALIEEVPKALEPQMTKGRILQAWAETDATKFPEAVAHWAALRFKLAPIIDKKGNHDLKGSYYEINYNVALCLLLDAQKTNNAEKAFDAQKVLNAMLITSPKLDSPETVAKYRELLKRSADFGKKGGAKPAAAPAGAAASK